RPLSQTSCPFISLSFWPFCKSRLACATQIDPKRSATALAAISLAIASAEPVVTQPPQLKPITANTIAPPAALNKPNFVFSQSIRHLLQCEFGTRGVNSPPQVHI